MENTNIEPDYHTRFVNPYNFIPLRDECKREDPKIGDKESFTGYFECTMKMLTPLFIPNTSSSKRLISQKEYKEGGEDYKGYDFFSYEDLSEDKPYTDSPPLPPCNPVIPGSEIRGAVRSVYEAAFNGCMSSVDGDRELSRRCGEVKKPGILYRKRETKEWFLKPCGKVRLNVEQEDEVKSEKVNGKLVRREEYNSWKEGQGIYVKTNGKNIVINYVLMNDGEKGAKRLAKPYKKGYLHKGEYIDGKEYESVFYEARQNKLKVSDEEIDLLKRVLSEYRDSKKNDRAKSKEWYAEYKVSEERTLVYYSKTKDNHFYLCPACIGREAYTKTVKSLLINHGGYQPCTDNKLCPACQIFGMMEKAERAGTYAYGSKVRFTDAVLDKPVTDSSILFEQPVVLHELGEPRPSAVEFYTESPYKEGEYKGGKGKKGYWTYDYKYEYQSEDKRVLLEKNLPKMRGRKYYWHLDVNMDKYKDEQISNMKQRIRPMKPENESQSKFQFRVYFEELDKKQLQQLKWALDFGNIECAHKIGRAKPFGFGSVQITVDRLHTRDINEETGNWEMITINNTGELNFGHFFEKSGFCIEEVPEALKIMANWKNRPDCVSYPIGTDERASYQWFEMNKQEKLKYNFSKVLPVAEEEARRDLKQEKALYKLTKK